MHESPWLTPEEVQELTARKQWKAQCRMLSAMDIPFRPNGVGRPLVERAIVLSAAPTDTQPQRKGRPNWAALKKP